jgi:hypothetical protein
MARTLFKAENIRYDAPRYVLVVQLFFRYNHASQHVGATIPELKEGACDK